ncbi:hypothetical protein [Nocardioides sp.]|uniref:hypothetical protein n=1 Tax=Nocardioides sp. TaxID=35761 RepID=UPI00262C94CF|nr:hypothetical protein [Nocardioides sp.]MCW2738337.1 hypothetical protein [Nocardioides sp.]
MPFGRKKSLMDRAHDYVEQLSETVLPQLESAWEQTVDKAGPALADARDKATPLIAEGRALAAEKASEARDKAAPLIAEARATAADKASVGAALAAERASASRDLAAAKVAELRGIEPEPRGCKLKKVLLLGGLLAIGGVIFSKLRAKQDDNAHWQSTYVPPAPPKPSPAAPAAPVTPATTTITGDPLTDPLPGEDVSADDVVTVDPPASDDIGGGAPGEAISDSVEEAHEATTPDEPAEVIDIDDVPHKK